METCLNCESLRKERDEWRDREKVARFDVENRIAQLSTERDRLRAALEKITLATNRSGAVTVARKALEAAGGE